MKSKQKKVNGLLTPLGKINNPTLERDKARLATLNEKYDSNTWDMNLQLPANANLLDIHTGEYSNFLYNSICKLQVVLDCTIQVLGTHRDKGGRCRSVIALYNDALAFRAWTLLNGMEGVITSSPTECVLIVKES